MFHAIEAIEARASAAARPSIQVHGKTAQEAELIVETDGARLDNFMDRRAF
jgi:hypothetical protein